MSATGRPEREFTSAQREFLVSATGRPEREFLVSDCRRAPRNPRPRRLSVRHASNNKGSRYA